MIDSDDHFQQRSVNLPLRSPIEDVWSYLQCSTSTRLLVYHPLLRHRDTHIRAHTRLTQITKQLFQFEGPFQQTTTSHRHAMILAPITAYASISFMLRSALMQRSGHWLFEHNSQKCLAKHQGGHKRLTSQNNVAQGPSSNQRRGVAVMIGVSLFLFLPSKAWSLKPRFCVSVPACSRKPQLSPPSRCVGGPRAQACLTSSPRKAIARICLQRASNRGKR